MWHPGRIRKCSLSLSKMAPPVREFCSKNSVFSLVVNNENATPRKLPDFLVTPLNIPLSGCSESYVDAQSPWYSVCRREERLAAKCMAPLPETPWLGRSHEREQCATHISLTDHSFYYWFDDFGRREREVTLRWFEHLYSAPPHEPSKCGAAIELADHSQSQESLRSR